MIRNQGGSITEELNTRGYGGYGGQYTVEDQKGDQYTVQTILRPDDIEFDPPQRLTSVTHIDDIYSGKHKGAKGLLFSKMEKGDLRNSIITFLTACVGAGILSFPQIFSFFGIIMGLVITAFSAYLNYHTYYIIDIAINLSGRRGYGNICSYFFGKRIAKFCIYGMMSVLFMISSVYASITWNFLERLLNDYKVVQFPLANPNTGEFQEYASKTFIVRLISMLVIFALCYPLMLFRKLTALRFITAGIMGVIVYIFFITVIQTPYYISHFKNKDSYEIDLWPPAFSNSMVSGFGALSMSFSSQPIFIFIRSEMIHKSVSRTKKVYKNGLIIEFFIYSIFGLCGYLSMGKYNVPTIFTQRHAISGSDVLMIIARWAFLPLIALHVLLPFISLRESIFQFLKIERSNTKVALVTLFLGLAAFMLPVVYPNVLALMGIFGGLFSGFFCCVSLLIMGIKMSESMLDKVKYFIFAAFFVWSALANTYVSVSGIFSQ